jgi:hypothetical protein
VLQLKDEIDGRISTNKQDDRALALVAFSAKEGTHISYLAVHLYSYTPLSWGLPTQHGPTITIAGESYTKIFKHLITYNKLLQKKPEQLKV